MFMRDIRGWGMRRAGWFAWLAGAFAAVGFLGCSGGSPQSSTGAAKGGGGQALCFVAASTKDAVQELVEAFRSETGATIKRVKTTPPPASGSARGAGGRPFRRSAPFWRAATGAAG